MGTWKQLWTDEGIGVEGGTFPEGSSIVDSESRLGSPERLPGKPKTQSHWPQRVGALQSALCGCISSIVTPPEPTDLIRCPMILRRRNDPHILNNVVDFIRCQRHAIWWHHGGLTYAASSHGNNSPESIIALTVQQLSIIQQRRVGSDIGAIGGACRRRIGMTPHTLLIEHPFALRLTVA